MFNQWITIKGKLVNINNFDTIEWGENIDRHGKKSVHLSLDKLNSNRGISFSFDDVNEIDDIAQSIAISTYTLKPIFNHDLANDEKWFSNKTVNPNAEFIGE